ncbi:MAG: hypothetical protein EXR62_15155 [Chloroflexi bacterium]|nr:hypothetical protein [Chloroflexota bacterium]
MSIRVGIYEFFARTIPGGFYLATILYLCSLFGLIQVDYQKFNDFPATLAIILALFSYVLTNILENFASLWFDLFRPKNYSEIVLDDFKKKHPSIEINVKDKEWFILLAYLKRESIEVANDIEIHNANSIMLKNISLNFFLLSLIQVFQFLQTNYIWNLIFGSAFIIASIASGRRAKKYRRWYYSAILEAIVSYSLDPSTLVTKRQKITPPNQQSIPTAPEKQETPKL